MVDFVFFYGTLMKRFGYTRSLCVERHIALVGRGTVPGALYEVGSYPALVVDPSRRVVGEVHQMSHPGRVVQVLDEYEGYPIESPETGLYVRQLVDVQLDSGDVVRAWAYFYNAPLGQARRIESGDYVAYTRASARSVTSARCDRQPSAS